MNQKTILAIREIDDYRVDNAIEFLDLQIDKYEGEIENCVSQGALAQLSSGVSKADEWVRLSGWIEYYVEVKAYLVEEKRRRTRVNSDLQRLKKNVFDVE